MLARIGLICAGSCGLIALNCDGLGSFTALLILAAMEQGAKPLLGVFAAFRLLSTFQHLLFPAFCSPHCFLARQELEQSSIVDPVTPEAR